MTTKQKLLAHAAARLEAAGVDSPRTDARVLLAHALGVTVDELLMIERVDPPAHAAFDQLLSRRVSREPLAYIIGTKEFFSLDFEVGPGVLIPRPETETLVEEALKTFPDHSADLHVLDFGSGSGCLIITFLLHYPRATGLAIDASKEALVWAARNAGRHGVAGRLAFVTQAGGAPSTFDVVLANPPYLTEAEYRLAAPEISRHEPKPAFVGGADGLDGYRALATSLAENLAPQGLAFVEIGAGQASQVADLFVAEGLEVLRSVPDLGGIPRCVVVGRQGRTGTELQKTVGKQPASR